MRDANLKAQLAAYLERMTQPVEIVASLDDTQASRDMQALLKDITDASGRITVTETRAGPHRTPSFPVNRPGQNNGPRFAGLPRGQEFTSLVRLLNSIIIESHKDCVSDIHIESYPGKEKIRVRFRKDGTLSN